MARKKNTKKQEQQEQETLENKEELKEEKEIKEEQKEEGEEKETKEEKLYKVEVKIAKKGVEKFYRAGFKFTADWQEIKLTKEQLTKVKDEKMLIVKEVK